jgi:hypothetical protein
MAKYAAILSAIGLLAPLAYIILRFISADYDSDNEQ